MDKFLGLAVSQRRNVYESVAQKVGLLPRVVEKDFWVTAILQAVFALPMAGHLVFKGGTSLSKGWKLLDRFSEDIDLAMDPSLLGENLPITPLTDSVIHTAIPAKTFLEKVFLLHELFSVPGHGVIAERKSRHLYDLYVMMNKDFAREAVTNDDLWESIRHHREIYTSVRDVDYSPDVRRRLRLIPGEDILNIWRDDYDAMSELIYGNRPSFEELLEGLSELQRRFREVL